MRRTVIERTSANGINRWIGTYNRHISIPFVLPTTNVMKWTKGNRNRSWQRHQVTFLSKKVERNTPCSLRIIATAHSVQILRVCISLRRAFSCERSINSHRSVLFSSLLSASTFTLSHAKSDEGNANSRKTNVFVLPNKLYVVPSDAPPSTVIVRHQLRLVTFRTIIAAVSSDILQKGANQPIRADCWLCRVLVVTAFWLSFRSR